jgi:molecular chaperone GrpE
MSAKKAKETKEHRADAAAAADTQADTGREKPGDETAAGSAENGDADTARSRNGSTSETADDQARLQEANDRLLRTKAEFENYRKRVQREFAEIREQTKLLVIQEFLTVYDHFQMALSHADSDDLASLRQGMEMIHAEFRRTLGNLGAEEIEALGKPFDPETHDALAQEPSPEVPEGHVLRQWKAGFKLGERLLRPATVVVSAGPPDTHTDADERES